jgi:hypothetical protein
LIEKKAPGQLFSILHEQQASELKKVVDVALRHLLLMEKASNGVHFPASRVGLGGGRVPVGRYWPFLLQGHPMNCKVD